MDKIKRAEERKIKREKEMKEEIIDGIKKGVQELEKNREPQEQMEVVQPQSVEPIVKKRNLRTG